MLRRDASSEFESPRRSRTAWLAQSDRSWSARQVIGVFAAWAEASKGVTSTLSSERVAVINPPISGSTAKMKKCQTPKLGV